MAKKSSDARMNTLRWTILGFIGAVAVLVILYGMLYSTGATEGEFAEGEHYQEILTDVRRRPGAPVEVIEFFSYGCVHCMNFDPLIKDWEKGAGENVRFRRQPVAFNPIWTLLGRTYITFEQLDILEENHSRVFRAVHDQGKQFLTPEMMADFVDGNGATREEFLSAFNSADVRRQAARMESETRAKSVNSVPTIVVGGQYMVNMGVGRKIALDVVDHLVARIRAEDAGP